MLDARSAVSAACRRPAASPPRPTASSASCVRTPSHARRLPARRGYHRPRRFAVSVVRPRLRSTPRSPPCSDSDGRQNSDVAGGVVQHQPAKATPRIDPATKFARTASAKIALNDRLVRSAMILLHHHVRTQAFGIQPVWRNLISRSVYTVHDLSGIRHRTVSITRSLSRLNIPWFWAAPDFGLGADLLPDEDEGADRQGGLTISATIPAACIGEGHD